MTILLGHFRSMGPSDVTAPTITAVTLVSQTYNPYLHRLCGISLKVEFSETMDEATGSGATASLTIGGVSKTATSAGWIDGDLYLTYVLDGSEKGSVSVSSPLVLASGTLKDLAGNNCTLTFTPPDTSALVAVMRGVQWASDFSQGADAQVLYGVARNITVSSSNGRRGSSTGSDSEDPTWGANGAEFDGNDYFSDVPYTDKTSFVDTTNTWSVHTRIFVPTGGSKAIWHTYDAGGGTWIIAYAGWLYVVNRSNVGYGSGNGGYRTIGIPYGDPDGWYTVSVVCSAEGAGGIKVYINGTQTGTISWANDSLSTDSTLRRIGSAPSSGVNSWAGTKMRAIFFCNVAHDSTEVSNAHAMLEAMAA